MALLFGLVSFGSAQFSVNYDPNIQSVGNIQYFAPKGDNLFVGDCIPFYKDGKYYLYWLLDRGHHSSLNGLGGHQWCVSTSTDLKTWKHYPIAIGIDEDWEKSICTGSVAFDGKQFYAFYATRLITADKSVNEQLSYAISKDAFKFEKQKPNPFYTSAPGYSKRNFRDPKVIIDEKGIFHLFVATQTEKESVFDGNGCLAHLTSKDLKNWNLNKPIISGLNDVPECPDYFKWNGWYYLIYGQGGDTYYVKSHNPYDSWEYPASQVLIEQWVNVAKTAEFKNNRRIAAGWIPSKQNNKDNGNERFGGNIILREVYQLSNGDLATKFVKECIPAEDSKLNFKIKADENSKIIAGNSIQINALGAQGCSSISDLPFNCRITMTAVPKGVTKEFGLFLRTGSKANDGYKLAFDMNRKYVQLSSDAFLNDVSDLNKPFTIDIIMKDDIVDVCIGNRRCIVNRLIEKKGDSLWFFVKQGSIEFDNIQISTIR